MTSFTLMVLALSGSFERRAPVTPGRVTAHAPLEEIARHHPAEPRSSTSDALHEITFRGLHLYADQRANRLPQFKRVRLSRRGDAYKTVRGNLASNSMSLSC
jgi:hypothetical protein